MRRIIGLSTLVIVFVSVIAGDVAVFMHSKVLGFVYLGLVAISGVLVVYSYCAKCLCRKNCAHIIPGLITGILPERVPGPYGFLDSLVTVVSLLIIVGFPQPWLYNNLYLAVIFWIPIIISGSLIPFALCKGCGNKYCLMSR